MWHFINDGFCDDILNEWTSVVSAVGVVSLPSKLCDTSIRHDTYSVIHHVLSNKRQCRCLCIVVDPKTPQHTTLSWCMSAAPAALPTPSQQHAPLPWCEWVSSITNTFTAIIPTNDLTTSALWPHNDNCKYTVAANIHINLCTQLYRQCTKCVQCTNLYHYRRSCPQLLFLPPHHHSHQCNHFRSHAAIIPTHRVNDLRIEPNGFFDCSLVVEI